MSTNEDLLARRAAVVPRGVGQFAGPLTAASARGAILRDSEGRELIDFAGGIGVMNVGHCNERVVAAIREQAGRLLHACIHVATYEPYVALCEKLAALLPLATHGAHGAHGDAPGGTKVMLVNSGAEAVENAIKIARQATGRPAVICFSEAFHGRTLLCATLTSKTSYKIGCGPFAPEVYRLPFPSHFHRGDGLDLDSFVRRELERLEQAFLTTVRADAVAAVIIEVVQGEGGFTVAPPAYLRGLRDICDEIGAMLIIDEIQTGFCRTGRWAAYEHAGVRPDLSTWAKSMGGGLPISAVVGRAEVMDAAQPGTLGGTYGGNPVACAAALAAIGAMEEERLNERAERIGKTVRRRFEAIAAKCPAVGDVRGLGAMLAMEFVPTSESTRVPADLVREIMSACRERGLLVVSSGIQSNVIRFLAPLVIADAELARGLDILEQEVLRLTATPELAGRHSHGTSSR